MKSESKKTNENRMEERIKSMFAKRKNGAVHRVRVTAHEVAKSILKDVELPFELPPVNIAFNVISLLF